MKIGVYIKQYFILKVNKIGGKVYKTISRVRELACGIVVTFISILKFWNLKWKSSWFAIIDNRICQILCWSKAINGCEIRSAHNRATTYLSDERHPWFSLKNYIWLLLEWGHRRTNSKCHVLTQKWPIVQGVQHVFGRSHLFQWKGQMMSSVYTTLRACDKILSLSNKDKTVLLHLTH